MQKAKIKKSGALARNVYISGLVSFFMDFSSEMIYPLVPLFLANVLGVNKSVIGLIEGMADLPQPASCILRLDFGPYRQPEMAYGRWI